MPSMSSPKSLHRPRSRSELAISPSFSRRALFGGAGLLAAGTVAACSDGSGRDGVTAAAAAVKFNGAHQASIVTAQQDRLHFAAFNVVTKDRAELEELLRT